MNDILNDIEKLSQAIVLIEEGASDEKEMAMTSLEKLLAEKKAIMVAFEKEMAPKDPNENAPKETFQRWK